MNEFKQEVINNDKELKDKFEGYISSFNELMDLDSDIKYCDTQIDILDNEDYVNQNEESYLNNWGEIQELLNKYDSLQDEYNDLLQLVLNSTNKININDLTYFLKDEPSIPCIEE